MSAEGPSFSTGRAPVRAGEGQGMVATSQPDAVAAGLAAYARGGNAADAAVSAAAVLAVTEPTSCGPGGDCFALYYEARSGKVHALNGSGRAPAGLTLERVRRDGYDQALPPLHGHTITVPGAVAAWCDLLARFGVHHIALALQPAIQLARDGFAVQPVTAHAWARGANVQLQAANGDELLIDGRAPRAGERFVNRGLARVLAGIAARGRDGFYQGATAEAVAAAAQAAGGTLTVDDLAAHQSTWAEAISARYGALTIHEHPPNGQGIVALIALRILEHLDARAARGAQRLHLCAEALRLAFHEALPHVADPAVAPVPVAALLADERTRALAAAIDRDRAGAAAPVPLPRAGGTVYLTAVDAAGNACSLIQSNYMGFGAAAIAAGCGFTLQNRGHNFSLDPDHPNCAAPGKRPYHTIIPALATRERALAASFGVMGGFMQPQGHVQVAMGLWDDGLDPQAALDRPRMYVDPHAPDAGIAVEEGTPAGDIAALTAMGHRIRVVSGWERALFGRGQVILRDASGLLGGSDGRADGLAGAG